ncbi:hypothetical protein FRC11_008460 [Ceratobasidium sp. 423]|nr:hypothetical protein FRC11_008460 [Ceratobasidium sp. 423]
MGPRDGRTKHRLDPAGMQGERQPVSAAERAQHNGSKDERGTDHLLTELGAGLIERQLLENCQGTARNEGEVGTSVSLARNSTPLIVWRTPSRFDRRTSSVRRGRGRGAEWRKDGVD